MIPGFPAPYPDELIGSLLARAVRHTGLKWKALVARLGGSRSGYVSWLLSAPLVELAPHTGRSASQLLWGHTVFPYSTAFMHRSAVATIEATLLERPVRAPWSAVPLVQSVTQGLSHRRYCPVCARHDLATLGESYWHRKHNLPGVFRCVLHGVPLHETQIGVRDHMRTFSSTLPGEVRGYVKYFAVPVGVLADISRRSAAALERPLTADTSLREVYRKRLAELGLLRGGQVASHDFAYQMLKLYGRAFLRICGADYRLTEKSPWPALVARSLEGASLAPIKHILVQAYLASSATTSGPRQWARPGPKAPDWNELDRVLVRRLVANLHDPRSEAGLVPIHAWLTDLGCWSIFRHSRHELPMTARLVSAVHQSRRANQVRLRQAAAATQSANTPASRARPP